MVVLPQKPRVEQQGTCASFGSLEFADGWCCRPLAHRRRRRHPFGYEMSLLAFVYCWLFGTSFGKWDVGRRVSNERGRLEWNETNESEPCELCGGHEGSKQSRESNIVCDRLGKMCHAIIMPRLSCYVNGATTSLTLLPNRRYLAQIRTIITTSRAVDHKTR